MPSTLTYPGVYVDEIPSGVHTLTGVATSVTAFMGRTKWGPVAQPVLISSYKDFERQFGGLTLNHPVSYAVNDFFRNGGSQALIVRQYHPNTVNGNAVSGVGQFVVGNLTLAAASPGAWANNLVISIDNQDAHSADVALQLSTSAIPITTADLFNLTITINTQSGQVIERYVNLTVKDTVRRVDRVLAQLSKTVTFPASATLPTSTPTPTPVGGVTATAGTALDSAPLDTTDYVMTALDQADTINMVCIPPDVPGGDTPNAIWASALNYCVSRRAILIVDPPGAWSSQASSAIKFTDLGISGTAARNAAVYHPRMMQSNPLRAGLIEQFPACGVIAGIIARTDSQRGIWKAPAGLDASLSGVDALAVKLTDNDSGILNPQGINCLRAFPVAGQVIWGARTMRGADALGDDYKYLSVRRLALYIEESIYRGTQWAVFEPNDAPLWTQLRLNIGSFMQNLFRQGAFQGQTPKDAYFVKCDDESTTADDINAGRVNIVVGFAPLKPAEFVVIQLQQMAGQNSA